MEKNRGLGGSIGTWSAGGLPRSSWGPLEASVSSLWPVLMTYLHFQKTSTSPLE